MKRFTLSLIVLALVGVPRALLALDDWDRAVDIAVCYQGAAYSSAEAHVKKLLEAHQLNGIILEFYHDKDGKMEMVSLEHKPEGFLILVQDNTVAAARKLLQKERSHGLKIDLLHRSLFFPERNKKEFILKNGSWDAPNSDYKPVPKA
jgi:hypothetical protein